MSVNKVRLANGETIIDISDSTVTPETLAEGVTAHDASGQKITGKMIPGGGSSVQTDWNQNDETQPDFLKNKPFGDVPTVLYEGTNLSPENDDGAYLLETPIIEIIEGESYSVVLDGIEYVAEGTRVQGVYVIVGNPGIVGGEDNGLPFVWVHNPEYGLMMFLTFAPFTSLCISADNAKKISAKYYDVQAVFYAKTPYIYKDLARTITATKQDVLDVVNKMPIVIDCGIGRAQAVYVGTSDDYAKIFFYANTTVDVISQYKLYTSEYTET